MTKAEQRASSTQRLLDELRGQNILFYYQKPYRKPYKVCCDLCESAWRPESGAEWHNVGCPIVDAAVIVRDGARA